MHSIQFLLYIKYLIFSVKTGSLTTTYSAQYFFFAFCWLFYSVLMAFLSMCWEPHL